MAECILGKREKKNLIIIGGGIEQVPAYKLAKRRGLTIIGTDINVVICKELTKKFEEIKRDKIINLIEYYTENTFLKGEHIILVNNNFKKNITEEQIISQLLKTSSDKSMKDKVNLVTKKLEISRKKVYEAALKINSKTNFKGQSK